ncbi:hypothetical protein V6U90_07550 [Micromonospora sp. CPCC 206060]|uniref:hypothetical protein n=1 Tax=Micromonospora sp. CPCC 206060 TaxID=3122406 RepID=UPI002FEEE778
MTTHRPGRFDARQLRLALAAPRPAAGLTSEWAAHNRVAPTPVAVAVAVREFLAQPLREG